MTVHIPFDNTFARLPARFYSQTAPSPVPDPSLLVVNSGLARDLGIDPDALASPAGVKILAGNQIGAGSEPLSQVYAGHQFGGWSPQLGDGRAVLLGEVVDRHGQRRDIQLKGSGRTPYSRGGDGRAWLGPVLREYVVSEAMHALGIATTRALAAVTTGELVRRETNLPGAVLTRVAASHVRVGTFQYFAARGDTQALQELCNYVIARHYPDAASPLELLNGVIERQAHLIARWMGVGFIHGVMNTDNMAISGETIDYGPCAFQDVFDPDKTFSSIDQFGRYSYGRQPKIAAWNLAQFASCLLPLMGKPDAAIQAATDAVNRFDDIYQCEWVAIFRRKIGLSRSEPGDTDLIGRFLEGLAQNGFDFTGSFRNLADFVTPEGMGDWQRDWAARLKLETSDPARTMRAANPAFIARNHRIEAMIGVAVNGDLRPFEKLNEILAHPYSNQPENAEYRSPPKPDETVQATFCGT